MLDPYVDIANRYVLQDSSWKLTGADADVMKRANEQVMLCKVGAFEAQMINSLGDATSATSKQETRDNAISELGTSLMTSKINLDQVLPVLVAEARKLTGTEVNVEVKQDFVGVAQNEG